jgi:hypothetical protein
MTPPEDERAFLCDAFAQLAPNVRPVFTARWSSTCRPLPIPGLVTLTASASPGMVGEVGLEPTKA